MHEKNNLKTPDNYFNSLKKKLKQIPEHDDLENPNPFAVPDIYFEELKSKLSKIPKQQEVTRDPKTRTLWSYHHFQIAAALVGLIAIVFGLYFWFPKATSSIDKNQKWAAETTLYELYIDEEEPIEVANASIIAEYQDLLVANSLTLEEPISEKAIEDGEENQNQQKTDEVDEILEELFLEPTESMDSISEEMLSEESLFY